MLGDQHSVHGMCSAPRTPPPLKRTTGSMHLLNRSPHSSLKRAREMLEKKSLPAVEGAAIKAQLIAHTTCPAHITDDAPPPHPHTPHRYSKTMPAVTVLCGMILAHSQAAPPIPPHPPSPEEHSNVPGSPLNEARSSTTQPSDHLPTC